MRPTNQEIAEEIIRSVSRERPADAALREWFKKHRETAPFDAAEVSRTVFRHYRWLGWSREQRNLEAKLRFERQVEARFRTDPASIPLADLRARAVPEWVWEEVEADPDWLKSLQQEPKLWLRAKRGRGRALAEQLGHAQTLSLPDAVIYEGETDLFKTAEFHAGEFEIQDISSQIVGLLCDPKPGETWWDACSGEGGKTLHLSDLMENKGLIWASDRAEWRLKNLKRRAARARAFNYRSVVWDGGAKLPTKTMFDGVLVDAPCSGVGTWQKNPHGRWTLTLQDVKELAEVQKRLLAHVAPSVKPEGKLIYSVCTLTHSECGEVVMAFNENHPAFEPLPLNTAGLVRQNDRALTSAATVTLWPQDFGGNGMFVVGWRRKG